MSFSYSAVSDTADKQCTECNLDHEKLLTLLAQRVADSRVLRLMQAMLKAGSYGQGKLFPSERGTPQGGVASPLLSNVLLTPFDQEMRRKGYQLTRFADDWVITCKSAAEARAALVAATRILEQLGVRLNPQKTRIIHACRLKLRVFLLGGTPGVLEATIERVQLTYPELRLCGAHSGYFADSEIPEIVEKIQRSAADLLLISRGSSLQADLISRCRNAPHAGLIWNTGGLFDFVSGRVPRAPKWMRNMNRTNLGLEGDCGSPMRSSFSVGILSLRGESQSLAGKQGNLRNGTQISYHSSKWKLFRLGGDQKTCQLVCDSGSCIGVD